MATIDARTRMSLYQKLLPILGDNETNALMSTYPSIEAEEVVTKQFLRAEVAELRTDMADLRTDMAELRTELRGEVAGLRTDMGALENRLTLRIGAAFGANTTIMLAAFALFS